MIKLQFFLLLIGLFLLNGCKDAEVQNNQVKRVYCDAETVKGDKLVSKEGVELYSALRRTNERSRSGNYSIKLDSSEPYGMAFQFLDVKMGEIVRASVWKYGNQDHGSIVISDEKSECFNGVNESFIEEDGWFKLTVTFKAKKDFPVLKVFCSNEHTKPVYFDDLTIERLDKTQFPWLEKNKMVISIPNSAMDSIAKYREQAVEYGVITSEMKSYFNGKLDVNGEQVPIELRLKGDWADHLMGEKWSFRIKTDDEAFRGMKTFSIQSPETRNMLNEWFAHKVFEREGILSTRYDFVNVEINGESKGIYALEEHFDKQLIESQNRREGPIVKFDESGMWEVVFKGKTNSVWYYLPLMESSQIIPFKAKRTYKKSILSNQFRVAQSHLSRFRNRDQKIEEYLDVDRMAKYIALTDLLQGKHALAWHNLRFYMNPITNVLEPIGFDLQPGAITDSIYLFSGEELRYSSSNKLLSLLFENVTFKKRYANYLQKYSSEDYLNSLHADLDDKTRKLEEILQLDYGVYHFDYDFIDRQAKLIRAKLPVYFDEIESTKTAQEYPDFDVLPQGELFPNIALNAYREAQDSVSRTISFSNYHSHGVTIVGYSSKVMNGMIFPLNKPIKLKAFNGKSADYSQIVLPGKPNRIFYKADNVPNRIFSCKPIKWGMPKKVNLLTDESGTSIFVKNGGVLRLKAGKYQIKEDIVVPSGMKVVFDPGVHLDLINHACFISRSPVELNGTKTNRVIISSSDNTGNGFTILSKGSISKLNYVTFDGLNTLSRPTHQLTGAVTFYESVVIIDHCVFKNNVCEDALNLVRSNFKLLNSSITKTFSDGFDGDFCTGIIENCSFSNTGNDGIDVSGSFVYIENCSIDHAGDKGISGGEQSKVFARKCHVKNAVYGAASKDNSVVTLIDLNFDHINTVYAAFMKKWEYGPAVLKTKNCRFSDFSEEVLIDKDSKIIQDNKERIGHIRIDVDSIYVAN